MAIKAQALADFIAEFTFPDEENLSPEAKRWTIQTDSLSAQGRGGAGVIVTTPDGGKAQIWSSTEIPGYEQRGRIRRYTNGAEAWKGPWNQAPVSSE